MEFGEKLQNLRKSKGLTQEELAESLYVSRTAVSKWESGRGYPSIDSLKEIAAFFSVTVDQLLSGEKVLSLAEKENRANVQKLCDLLFGATDLFSLLLIILPLYPNAAGGHVYSVSLSAYRGSSPIQLAIYWAVFIAMAAAGALKLALTQAGLPKGQKLVTVLSLALGIVAVLFLSISRQVYATVLVFALLVIKGLLFLKYSKA